MPVQNNLGDTQRKTDESRVPRFILSRDVKLHGELRRSESVAELKSQRMKSAENELEMCFGILQLQRKDREKYE